MDVSNLPVMIDFNWHRIIHFAEYIILEKRQKVNVRNETGHVLIDMEAHQTKGNSNSIVLPFLL